MLSAIPCGCLVHLAKGDLSETITQEYQGSFNQLKQDANATISKIKQVIEGDIQAIVDAALFW